MKFPCKMKSIKNGNIVEFQSECCGTIVASTINMTGYRVGDYSSSWYSCFDTTVWTPYRNPYRILGSKWRHQ